MAYGGGVAAISIIDLRRCRGEEAADAADPMVGGPPMGVGGGFSIQSLLAPPGVAAFWPSCRDLAPLARAEAASKDVELCRLELGRSMRERDCCWYKLGRRPPERVEPSAVATGLIAVG